MKNKPLFSFALFLACFMGVLAYGQTQVAPFVNSHVQFSNASGAAPCNGCLLDTFAAGTTTPLATYSESTGTTPNSNPVVLASDGSAVVYMTNASYKLRLRTAAGATIWTQDQVTWNNLATTLSSLTLTGNATINSSTAATNVANQSGPTFGFCGNYWTGAASASDCWNLSDVLGTGTNPTSTLTLVHSGSSGTPVFSVPALSASSATISGAVTVGSEINKGNAVIAGPSPWIDVTAPAYGCVGDGTTDNTACLNAAILVAENNKSSTIFFPCGNYRFASKPNSLGTGIWILGCGSAGSTTGFGTYLIADYTEASCASAITCNGFLTWDGSFVVAGGTGGGLRNVAVYKQSNRTAGAAIRLTGTDDNHRAGWWRADHVLVHGSQSPAGTWSYGLLIDGHNNTTVGTQGIRDIVLTDLWITNTTVTDGSAWFINCAKCSWYGGEVFAAGGTNPGITITGTGGAGANSSNSPENTLVMTISGDLVIDQASNVRAISEHVLGNLSITANAFKSSFIGRVDGTVSNLSTTSLAYIEGGGASNNNLHIQGAAMGASFDSTAPTGTAGNIYTRNAAVGGCVYFGDGSYTHCLQAAGTVSINAGNNATFTFAGTGTVAKSDHLAVTGTASGIASAAVYGWDATNTRGSINNGNGSIFDVAVMVGSGSVTTAGTAVGSGTCQAQTGISVANSAITDNVIPNINAALPATWQTGIALQAHVTVAGTVTVYLCNPTAGSITPAAQSVNVKVIR